MVRAQGLPARPATAALLAVPLVVAALLALWPDLDGRWQEPDVHVWVVGAAALAGLAIAVLAAEAASRRADARVYLLGLSFGTSAAFLFVHALATPGVVVDGANNAFETAVPVGLTVSAALAAASTVDLAPRTAALVLRRRAVGWVALALLAAGFAASVLRDAGPLADSPEARPLDGAVAVLGLVGTALFALAALRFLAIGRTRGRGLLVASLVAALVLLGDALVVVLVGRNWQASWWEWHLLLVAAFVALAATARREWRREGGRAGLFDNVALERTLERVRADYAEALDALVRAMERAADDDERDLAPIVAAVVRRFDLSPRQGDLLAQAAHALGENRRLYRELDRLFRSYLSPEIAAALVAQPDRAALGGAITEVSVLHADLSRFTAFSEDHEPAEVMAMLNTYFGALVPAVLAEGGTITLFAGDAVMAVFGAPSRQDDHAARACRAAMALLDAAEEARAGRDWPRFRVGVSTGHAIVGNVGSDALRSFTAIGDTVNVAARLEASAPVGGVLISEATRAAAMATVRTEPAGSLPVKGRAEPVAAHLLVAGDPVLDLRETPATP